MTQRRKILTTEERERVVRSHLSLLSRLQERQRRALELKYGLNGAYGHSFKEIGNVLGITRERAGQIVSQGIHMLQRLEEADAARSNGKAEARMWRCVRCGTWSHAKRRPAGHVRYLREHHPDLDDVPEDDIEWVSDGQDPDTGADLLVGKFTCGPFEEWRAERVESRNNRGASDHEDRPTASDPEERQETAGSG